MKECDHNHCHCTEDKPKKTILIKVVMALLIFAISHMFHDYEFYFILVSYIIVSYDLYIDGFKGLIKKDIFNENLLMIIATLGAFAIGENHEALMVIILYQIGEFLSSLAVSNTKKSITSLMNLRCDTVNIKINDKIISKDIKEVKIGEIFVVKPGEKIPLDGEIISGKSTLDTSSLTGESKPRKVNVGEEVLSGSINTSSILEIKATSKYETSTATKIINLIEHADEKKTKTERFITRFCRIYTPVVVLLALLIVIIPLIFGGTFEEWLYKALVFLVASCPCALVISVPLSYFCGIGKASKSGVLIKGSYELEKLSSITSVVFDKTGTVTEGVFIVTKIENINIEKDELLKNAAYAEYFSTHPIAESIKKSYSEEIETKKIKDFKEFDGEGISATINKKEVIIGSENLLEKHKIKCVETSAIGTIVHIAINKEYKGYIVISDKIKKEMYGLVEELYEQGISHVIMLSGDNVDIVSKVSKEIGIKEYHAELLPTEKVDKLEEIQKNDFTAFVGDGINDAPVIKLSDIGIAMGAIGSDSAIEAADVVLMKDDLKSIIKALKIAKTTKRICTFNIAFALLFKFIVLLLTVFGYTVIWLAVLADVGVTLFSILNSLRIMFKSYK